MANCLTRPVRDGRVRRDQSTFGIFFLTGRSLPKKRTALLQELKEVFRRSRSHPVEAVIAAINPKLRGWVNYFRIGHASRCLAFVRQWVERKVRRHLMRARNRRGFGWKRWSTAWLHATLGLFADDRVRYLVRA